MTIWPNEDVIGLWIGDCCVVHEDLDETSAFLYESYRRWKEARGEPCPGHKKFSSKLLERGFKRGRDANARKIGGLKLTDSEREAAVKGVHDRKSPYFSWLRNTSARRSFRQFASACLDDGARGSLDLVRLVRKEVRRGWENS